MVESKREIYIDKLIDELPVLRTKLGISQDEMGALIGISRQTYSSIETKKRKMTWSAYLALILILDYHEETHDYIRMTGLFPSELLSCRKYNREWQVVSSFLKEEDIKNRLDDQAIHAIETVIMMEYARCNNVSGDAVVKAFNGMRVTSISDADIKATAALKNIQAKSHKEK